LWSKDVGEVFVGTFDDHDFARGTGGSKNTGGLHDDTTEATIE
jgi:hypothetical protein